MDSHEIHTRASVVRFDDALGIVRLTVVQGSDETLADAQASVRAVLDVGAGHRPPLLVDMRGIKTQTREARQYYTGPQAERATRAAALLVQSRLSAVIATFFIGMNRMSVPLRIFTDENEALTWLQSFIE